MLNTDKLLSFLGADSTNNALVEYLQNISIDLNKNLFLNEGTYRAYIERPESGFSLVFSDEAYFHGRASQPIGQGKLYFSGVFFYSEGKDGYSEYKSSLPFGLSFKYTRADVLNNLGSSSWQRLSESGARVISDRWDDFSHTSYCLHVTYRKEGGISMLSIFVPDQPLS